MTTSILVSTGGRGARRTLLRARLPGLFRNGKARVVQVSGKDPIQDGNRVWMAV